VNALENHIKTLQGENDALKEQLAGADARSEKFAADFAARDARAVAELAAERERADKAIAALGRLADQIAALAEARCSWWPWWRAG
jgi:hypothetical protein